MNSTPIRYRDFYDVPRIFITAYGGKQYLFDCAFDDELEDYSDRYRIYELPALREDELRGSWEQLSDRAVALLDSVPVDQVEFDQSKRKLINTSLLDDLLTRDPRTSRVA
jgi:hypothetical protein